MKYFSSPQLSKTAHQKLEHGLNKICYPATLVHGNCMLVSSLKEASGRRRALSSYSQPAFIKLPNDFTS